MATTVKVKKSSSSSVPVVDIRNLSKTYSLMTGKKVYAVNDISFKIMQGETFGIVGPNGSGKTTTMKILLGLLFPNEGSEVLMFGRQPGDPEVQARLGYLPEAPYFYEYLTGRELLYFYGKLAGVAQDVLLKRTEEVLAVVDMLDRGADMQLRYYSRGMRQRIGIAQAMINDPELLILDEPTNGLDPLGTVQVRQFILNEKSKGRTILLCSHMLSEVEAVADQVAILHQGKLLAVGSISELVPESHQWQLVATCMSKAAVAALRTADFNPEVHGEIITMRTETLDDIYRGLGIVRDMGGDLLEITRPQPTLEQQFLKAVSTEDQYPPKKK
ncbi:MAG: ABC transporter ATP-binding protein [bacterium]